MKVKNLRACAYITSIILVGSHMGLKLEKSLEFQETQHRKMLVSENNTILDEIYNESKELELPLSYNAKQAIESISAFHDSDKEYVKAMGINTSSVSNAYNNFQDIKIINHKNQKYYDKKKNDIKWEQLINTIYGNSKKESLFTNREYLSKEEITKKVEVLKELTKRVKTDFEQYDLETLACNLEQCAMMQEELDSNIMAMVENNNIIYNKNKVSTKIVDLHEGIHFLIRNCDDIREEERVSRTNDGIHVATPKELIPGKISTGYLSRFQYTFLEEIYAELYACDISSMKQKHYKNYDEVLVALQITLGLQDSYKIDQILQNLIYQDPIAFMKNFRVYGENKEEYLIKNIQMLKSCDILLDRSEWYLQELETKKLTEYKTKGIYQLQELVMMQMGRNFYNNLIIMNEHYPNEMEIEDNFCMMRLFMNYLFQMNLSLNSRAQEKYEVDDSTEKYLLSDSNIKNLEEIMLTYLSEKKNQNLSDIKPQYNNYYLNKDYEFPSCIKEEKRIFYQEVLENVYDYKKEYPATLQKVK